MAERSFVYSSSQLGVESVPGTAVAANKRLLSVGFTMSPNPDIQVFRPSGFKYPTVSTLSREWTEVQIDGALTYTEIVYLLSGILETAVITGTTAKTWTFTPSSSAADAVKTFTLEQGDAVRARRVALGLMTELSLSISRSELTVSGQMIAGALEDNVTLTASPSEIALVPVMGTQVAIYMADTVAGLDAASPLDRPISFEWSLSNRFVPAWFLNQEVGFNAYVETEPELSVSMMMAADAEGMALLAPMRAGDYRYLRLEAVGATIAGADTYLLQIDTAVKVTDVGDFSEEEGIEAIGWKFRGFHSTDLGGAVKAVVVNELATL